MGGRGRQRHGCWKRISGLAVSALLLGVIVPPSASPETTAQDSGRAFEPRPLSAALYDKGQTISGYVTTADATGIYVETVLPGAMNGNVPPPKVPVVLLMTPYGVIDRQTQFATADYLIRRGYAFTFAHVLGTGGSEGCIRVGGAKEVDATAQVIAHLAAQWWSNGRVGMWGGSYSGMTQIGAAGLDDPRVRPLKAIVPLSAWVSWIENAAFDGVPSVPGITLGSVLYNGAFGSTVAGTKPDPTVLDDRHACAPDNLVHAAHHDVSGEISQDPEDMYWKERDYRWNVGNIRAATLMVHGFADDGNPTLGLSGFFERIPASTPRKLLLGQWAHEAPHRQSTHPEWRRADFLPMLVAWYDRYLLDLPTGVEAWPTVQVQDTSGQWRAEHSWPAPTHRYGHLPLSAGGTLGAAAPTGATTYSEAGVPAPVVTFTTPPLPDDLHLTGQSVLDLWVRLDRPDAHIGVNIKAVDASGNAIGPVAFFGARSARHLDPMPDNWFRQERGTDPEVSQPVRVPVRLAPVDFLVPKGGRLTVTVGASVPYLNGFPSAPSGAGTTVTILHDCTTMSALRFFLPNQDADLLNVLEPDEVKDPPEPLASHPARRLVTDGGGLATDPACGKRPVNPLFVLAGTA